jgi:hypothetical protein
MTKPARGPRDVPAGGERMEKVLHVTLIYAHRPGSEIDGSFAPVRRAFAVAAHALPEAT